VTPWNFPAAMATRKLGPALAAGCTTVLKPAQETPLTALAIVRALEEAGVPPGVVNVLPTDEPRSLVRALLTDPRVRKLSFTGSTAVGRELLAQAAGRVVNASMELGGNAPFLVLADADLDAAVEGAMAAKLRNGGEACTAANRFLVHESVAGEFGARLTAAMEAVRVGPGMEPGAQLGPLINEPAREKVERLVADAVDRGARVRTGGERLPGPGFFHPPTVLDRVAPGSEMLADEVFGPVAPIVGFADEADAIALANDTEHGLVAYVYSRDLRRAMAVGEAIETGMVGLNRGVVSDPAAPFGGVKQSGLGREGGHHGLLDFMEPKYFAFD
jgi:succinate-semialdehyde dehydrogenase / glutarate-semialdehyde dehydrogenase